MNILYRKHYSQSLCREMEYKIYGHAGKPILFIPCQSGRFYDFENFHMLEQWQTWIEAGECMVFSVDSIDSESWAAPHNDHHAKVEMHEKWYHYLVDEMVPIIAEASGRNDILPFGCSMGAMHGANLFFRRPDLFDGVFAISGLYDSKEFLGEYMDPLVYDNSPVDYLSNMPADHPYLQAYAQHKMIFAVGQGAWEGPLLESTRRLDAVCARKGIDARFCYWGVDVDHDWPWWFKMVALYAPEFLERNEAE